MGKLSDSHTLNMKQQVSFFLLLFLCLGFLPMRGEDQSGGLREVSRLKASVDRYVDKGTTYLSDRLQMHWQTHATVNYIRGEYYDHCGGDTAPVPTVQISGARSHATQCRRPKLEELPPRFEHADGLFPAVREDGTTELVPISKTGNIIQSLNNEILGKALDAARLWQLTGEQRYYDFAFSIFDTYMLGIYYTQMPQDVNHGHVQTIVGLQSFEVIHEDPIFKCCELYKILKQKAKEELHAPTSDFSLFTFHFSLYEDALRHWADIEIQNGVPHNNWNFIQARYILAIALTLGENDKYQDGRGRQYYLDKVLKDNSVRQWSLKKLADYGYDPSNGIWSECPGYSQVVLNDFIAITQTLRQELGIDLEDSIPVLRLAKRNNCQYLMPDSMLIGFGDTHPHTPAYLDPTAEILPSFAAPKTSWLVQRGGMNRMGSLAYALNASQGNHSHANGISLELYGRGLRLGPDAGIGYTLYSGDDYKEYYSQFPAHNTVCVDGVSSYPVMMSTHPFQILHVDPAPRSLGKGKAMWLSSAVCFREPETQSDQLRQVVLVQLSPTTGYYVDIFRSRRSDRHDKFHDYFYHNLGQTMTLTAADGTALGLQPTDELAFAGGHLYAYSYIYNKVGAATGADTRCRYAVNDTLLMTQWTKGEPDRTVIQALSPSTEGLSRLKNMPYDIRNTPTLTYVCRQRGQAWTRPFVNVFEPASQSLPGTVQSVTYPEVAAPQGIQALAVRVTHRDGTSQLILSTDTEEATTLQCQGKTYTVKSILVIPL